MVQAIPKYTSFEMAKIYRNQLLIAAGSAVQYKTWSNDFVRKELNRGSKLLEREEFNPIDPNDLTKEELEYLGSNRWSDENPIYLIPIWMVAFLKTGCKLICIDKTEVTYDPETVDNDHRAGLIAYGVIPKTN